jgi:NADH dehydrogenase/NADH:ubiquinone oxidoreductase subunit G
MSNKIKFEIDGKECQSEEGKYLVDAAKENGFIFPRCVITRD